jgi:hypothetical protein
VAEISGHVGANDRFVVGWRAGLRRRARRAWAESERSNITSGHEGTVEHPQTSVGSVLHTGR